MKAASSVARLPSSTARLIRSGRAILAFGILVGAASAGFAEDALGESEPLGLIRLDGGLRLYIKLDGADQLAELNLFDTIGHSISVNAYGEAISTWSVAGRFNCIVPAGGGKLCWYGVTDHPYIVSLQTTSAAEVFFDQGRYRLSRKANEAIDIHDNKTGVKWRYKACQLVAITTPSRELAIESAAGAIQRVWEVSGSRPKILLASVEEGETGVSAITFGSGRRFTFLWDDLRQLVAVIDSDKRLASFDYQDRLLRGVDSAKFGTRKFAWGKNQDFGRGNSRNALPVHLLSDGLSTYRYSNAVGGIEIVRHGLMSKREVKIHYNPATGAVHVADSGVR